MIINILNKNKVSFKPTFRAFRAFRALLKKGLIVNKQVMLVLYLEVTCRLKLELIMSSVVSKKKANAMLTNALLFNVVL